MYAVGTIITQALNGAGDTRTPSILNLIVFWLTQIPLAYGAGCVPGPGPERRVLGDRHFRIPVVRAGRAGVRPRRLAFCSRFERAAGATKRCGCPIWKDAGVPSRCARGGLCLLSCAHILGIPRSHMQRSRTCLHESRFHRSTAARFALAASLGARRLRHRRASRGTGGIRERNGDGTAGRSRRGQPGEPAAGGDNVLDGRVGRPLRRCAGLDRMQLADLKPAPKRAWPSNSTKPSNT